MRRVMMSKIRLIMFVVGGARIELHLPRRLLAGEVVVEHLARDRPCGAAAVLAVLDEDRERELRIVGGRERDEERVVPMLLLQALLVVALALLHADDLRGPGLGRERVGGALASLRRGASGPRHVDHRRANERDVLGPGSRVVRRR